MILLALAASVSLAQRTPSLPAGEFVVALAGDSILTRPLPSDPGFRKLAALVAGADAAYTNLETVFHDFEGWAMQERPSLRSDPRLARELAAMGFDLVSRANNHAFDYGAIGLERTSKALKKAGLVGAGAGEDLPRARAAGFFRTPRGTVALVAATSTFPEAARAGNPRGRIPGRPGVNPLRFTRTCTVAPEELERLRFIWQQLGLQPPPPTEGFSVGSCLFVAGEKTAVRTETDPRDLDALLASIKLAKASADFVIVSIHEHEPGADRFTPPQFLVDTSRAAVDAGADVVVSHGPHVWRGIEIHAGRPIFYGLGNFFFEYETVSALPADDYESRNMGPEATVEDFFGTDGRTFPDPLVWESALAVTRWSAGRVSKIEIYPITLGYGKPGRERGVPELASTQDGRRILERISLLSRACGTNLEIRDGVGIIAPGEP